MSLNPSFSQEPIREVGLAVTLAPESEHRVRPALDLAPDAAGEVHAEEGKSRVGDGVDEVPAQAASFGDQLVVLPPERHDARRGFESGEARDTVAVQPGAVNDARRPELPAARRHDHVSVALTNSRHARLELEERKLEADLIDACLSECDQDWVALARQVRKKKFGSDLPADFKEAARQMHFLQYRGFESGQIQRAVEPHGDD